MKLQQTFITLKDIRFFAYHGVLPEERIIGNDYLLSLTLYFPAGDAMVSDRVADTVNYAEVYEVVRRQMEIPSDLLEHVTDRILKALGEEFPILTAADCTVIKVNPPIPSFSGAGISFTATVKYR